MEAGSGRIVVIRRGEATVFAVPPAGYHLRNVFRVLLGGLFLIVSLVHVWYFFDSWGGPARQGPGFARLGWFACVQSLYWVSGLGLIVLALLHASRRATVSVRAGELRILEANAFRERVHAWAAGEVVSVAAVGATLKVGLANGAGFVWAGVPAPDGRVSEAEMAWLASELHEALELPSRGCESGEERAQP